MAVEKSIKLRIDTSVNLTFLDIPKHQVTLQQTKTQSTPKPEKKPQEIDRKTIQQNNVSYN